MELSPLQKARYAYTPKLPPVLRGPAAGLAVERGPAALPAAEGDRERLQALFPASYGAGRVTLVRGKGEAAARAGAALKVGVILSGGPAPGGHNVIAGLFDGLKAGNAASTLTGFRGGPGGLVDDKAVDITAELVGRYRNTGGFDIIGSGR
ncbi:MAG TPA: diphosphate--fructose-6-phosphate 1-phosphotransferase, partial [Spirochaetales bacterium]|nr:diphosphate--fructose-6-phosphate 1-phosphotransferase [Spirochaetales bacterium]